MKDFVKVRNIDNTEDVNKELCVENTVKNTALSTPEENNVPLVYDGLKKIIKLETDVFDDCMWESRIEIAQVEDRNSLLLSMEYQNESELQLKLEDTKPKDTFCCIVCGKCFDFNFHLKNHMAEHKKPTKKKYEVKCKFCKKKFKYNFGLNMHIKMCHSDKNSISNKNECNICKNFIDKEMYNEHMKSHENTSTKKKADIVLNLKLCKLNGVWKSKPNLFYKCKICVEKFDSEVNLVKHMKMHKCKNSHDGKLKLLTVSELNGHMHELSNKNLFRCQKCTLEFDNEQNLKYHLTRKCSQYSSNLLKQFSNTHNGNDITPFLCTVCGIGFTNELLFKKHVASDCKYHSCKSCWKTFTSKDAWLKHVNDREKYNKCVNSSLEDIESSVNAEYNLNVVEEDFNLNTQNEKLLYKTNIKERNTSDQINEANGSKLTGKNKTRNLVVNNCNLSDKNVNSSYINITKRHTNAANNNELNVQNGPHNLILNDCSPIAKKEKKLLPNVTKISSSDQIGIKNYIPHNFIVNECSLNIKKEKNLCTDFPESSSAVENKNLSTVKTVSHKLIVKKEPDDLNNDNIASVGRKTKYFSIRKSSDATYLNYQHRPLNNDIFICNICKKPPFTNLDLFALHMSEHRECSIHECIVCEKTFKTVILWTNHMTHHQQKINLKLPESQTMEIEPNILDSTNTESIEPQVIYSALENTKNERSSNRKFSSKYSNLGISTSINNSTNKSENQYYYNTLMASQSSPNKIEQFPCKYCDKTFSSRGPCTNHEKSHSNPNNKKKLFLQTNVDLQPLMSQNYLIVKNSNNNTIPIQNKKSKKDFKLSLIKKNFVCDICKKRFTRRCYWTNHMKIRHKINPKFSENLAKTSNSCNKIDKTNTEKCAPLTKRNKLMTTKEHTNRVVSINKNVQHFVKKNIKSAFCTICQKQFAHVGAFTSHMHVHSKNKPYKCRFCDRKFNMKGPLTKHEKSHKYEFTKEIQIAINKNMKQVKLEKIEEEQQIEINKEESEFIDSNFKNFTKKDRVWFVCDVCEKKFSTPFQLSLHRKLHSDLPYVCTICNKSYSMKFRWNWHLKSHYMKAKCIKNSKNNQQTSNPSFGTSKFKIDSVPCQKQFKCGYCKKEYSLLIHWKKHLSMSKECRRHCKSNRPEFTSVQAKENYMKSTRFECHICKRTYSTFYNRKVHLANVHKQFDIANSSEINANVNLQKKTSSSIQNNAIILKYNNQILHKNSNYCNLCGKNYSNRANLSRHIYVIHSNDNKVESCDICGKIFKNIYSCREHMRLKHNTFLRNKKTTIVGIDNTSKQHFVDNFKNKNNTIQYFCEICKTGIADSITLQKHMKTHTENKYKCNDCGQRFNTNVILGEHILSHHSISKSKNKKYAENVIQNISSQSSSNNPNQCHICSKIFKAQSYLSNHMILHTNIKPFKCDKCPKTFRFKSNLRIHKRKHYMENILPLH